MRQECWNEIFPTDFEVFYFETGRSEKNVQSRVCQALFDELSTGKDGFAAFFPVRLDISVFNLGLSHTLRTKNLPKQKKWW